jgi:hypothetical protein
MNRFASVAALLGCFVLSCFVSVAPLMCGATGTARIQQPDGSAKIYDDVHINIVNDARMLITSSDGKGTLVVNKASCTVVEHLLRCLAYSAELQQHGNTIPIELVSGTAWLNSSGSMQQLPHSSTQLAPRGVVMALETKRGTYVTLTGTVDGVTK